MPDDNASYAPSQGLWNNLYSSGNLTQDQWEAGNQKYGFSSERMGLSAPPTGYAPSGGSPPMDPNNAWASPTAAGPAPAPAVDPDPGTLPPAGPPSPPPAATPPPAIPTAPALRGSFDATLPPGKHLDENREPQAPDGAAAPQGPSATPSRPPGVAPQGSPQQPPGSGGAQRPPTISDYQRDPEGAGQRGFQAIDESVRADQSDADRARADEAKARADIAAAEAAQQKAAADEQSRKLEEAQQDRLQAKGLADLDLAQSRNRWQKIAETKVDPNRMWHNMSTGQQIGAAISLIVGGAAAGFSKRPNYAMDAMNHAIDRDVDAQVKDIENAKDSAKELDRLSQEQFGRSMDMATFKANLYREKYGMAKEQIASQAKALGANADQLGVQASNKELDAKMEQASANIVGNQVTLAQQQRARKQAAASAAGGPERERQKRNADVAMATLKDENSTPAQKQAALVVIQRPGDAGATAGFYSALGETPPPGTLTPKDQREVVKEAAKEQNKEDRETAKDDRYLQSSIDALRDATKDKDKMNAAGPVDAVADRLGRTTVDQQNVDTINAKSATLSANLEHRASGRLNQTVLNEALKAAQIRPGDSPEVRQQKIDNFIQFVVTQGKGLNVTLTDPATAAPTRGEPVK